jgi:Flp pilus assembly protein TadG
LIMVALLAIAAIVIDMGSAYAARRQMQNESDSASQAATRVLFKARGGVPPFFQNAALNASVATTATDVVSRNFGDSTNVACTVIRADQSVIAPCSPVGGWVADTTNGGPSGVRVQATKTETTAFGNVIGQPTTTSRARAAALIQPLITGHSPFIICGDASKGGWDILNPNKTVSVTKAMALGGGTGTIPIQESQAPTCGAGSAFKGKADDDGTLFSIPQWVGGANGNGNDHAIQRTVANAPPCPAGGPFTNCDLIIPIADDGAGNGNDIQMHIVALTVWHVTGDGTGNPKYFGTFLSVTTPITGGQAGSGPCLAGSACVIKLVQ